MRIALLSLLLSLPLSAQAQPPSALRLDFKTFLGRDPLSQIQLNYPGCWDGLLLGAKAPHRITSKRGQAGATVEVWDLLPPESPRQETLRLFRSDLAQRLARAFAAPPADNAQVDLAILMGCVAAQGNAAGVDMTMVQSLQERYNAMPPNGSPVRR